MVTKKLKKRKNKQKKKWWRGVYLDANLSHSFICHTVIRNMGKEMLKKGLAAAVILLFIGMCVVPSTAVQEFREKPAPISFDGNTLYVGGSGANNYTKIQNAINDAIDGDTVFVYNGIYDGGIIVNKSIILQGENREDTFINGAHIKNSEKIKEILVNNLN